MVKKPKANTTSFGRKTDKKKSVKERGFFDWFCDTNRWFANATRLYNIWEFAKSLIESSGFD